MTTEQASPSENDEGQDEGRTYGDARDAVEGPVGFASIKNPAKLEPIEPGLDVADPHEPLASRPDGDV